MRLREQLAHDRLIPIVQHVREQMRVEPRRPPAREHIARDDLHPLRAALFRDALPRDAVHRRLFPNRRPQVRVPQHQRARVNSRTARHIQQRALPGEVHFARQRRPEQQPAAIHRRRERLREILPLHRLRPSLRVVAAPVRRLARPQHPQHVQRRRAVLHRDVIRREIPRRTRAQMLARPQRAVKDAAGLGRQAHRGEERHHHVRGPRVDLELHADRPQRRRMLRQPREEIQMRHRRREQIDRDNAIAQPVERQRIGGGFGKEGVGHGGRRFTSDAERALGRISGRSAGEGGEGAGLVAGVGGKRRGRKLFFATEWGIPILSRSFF